MKLDALAKIKTLMKESGSASESSTHRSLHGYLSKLQEALEPLAPHEPVDAIASQFLRDHIKLFDHYPDDEATLQGLPQLLLEMGAHPYSTKFDKSTLSILLNENPGIQTKSESYFGKHYLIPYLQQSWSVQALCAGNEITFLATYHNDKEELMRQLTSGHTIFITELLMLSQGKETLLAHLLKIGSHSKTIKTNTDHYKTYINYLIKTPMSQEMLENAAACPDNHIRNTGPLTITHASGIFNDAVTLTELGKKLVRASLVKAANDNFSSLVFYAHLGAINPADLEVDLKYAVEKALENPLFPSQPIKERIQTLLDIGVDTHAAIPAFNVYLRASYDVWGVYGDYPSNVGVFNPLPVELIHHVFQCSLMDIESLNRLPEKTLVPLLFQALHYGEHASRVQLRQHYRQEIIRNPNISPLITTLYCAAVALHRFKFFGLGEAVFRKRMTTEITCSTDFIYTLFKHLGNAGYRYKSRFKAALSEAIAHLPTQYQNELARLINENKTTLGFEILRTQKHHDKKSQTKTFKAITEQLKTPAVVDVDSSDDEDEYTLPDKMEMPDEARSLEKLADVEEIKGNPLHHLYTLLLDGKLAAANTLLRQRPTLINQAEHWIQYKDPMNPRILLNATSMGGLLHKIWLEDETALSTEEKLKITELLFENGHSLFGALKIMQKNHEITLNYMDFAEKMNLPRLMEWLTENLHNGFIESQLHQDSKFLLESLKLFCSKINYEDESTAPLPLFAIAHYSQAGQKDKLTSAIFKKHLLSALTPEQTVGLSRLINLFKLNHYTNYFYSLQSWLSTAAQSLFKNDPELAGEFEKLKNARKLSAFSMILKQNIAQDRYAQTPYTLFKRTLRPKNIEQAQGFTGEKSMEAHYNAL